MEASTRLETDSIGSCSLPADCLWGIHTERARANFDIAARPVAPAIIEAYGVVKQACLLVNKEYLDLDEERYVALEQALQELSAGALNDHIVVDALQGGAGTSLNMNVNEVVANRALQLIGQPCGEYTLLNPLEHVNCHQSTNDTFPTAIKVAVMRQLLSLEESLLALQEAFQAKESEFADCLKLGRTQLQDAIPTTLGREMGAYAQACTRDRWRVHKCLERVRTVNLGGTAIGSGLGAPRRYIMAVVPTLRKLTGLPLAKADDLVDATQNNDAFVEVSGILKACAVNLLKIGGDLRLLASGPHAGFAEIVLPARQAGSSLMPGKVNPVIPEAIQQAALRVMALDGAVAHACGLGNLELNAFMPLIADSLLEEIALLRRAATSLRTNCVIGITANVDRCRAHVMGSTTVATVLVNELGYDRACRLAKQALEQGTTIGALAIATGEISSERLDELLSPSNLCRLGSPEKRL